MSGCPEAYGLPGSPTLQHLEIQAEILSLRRYIYNFCLRRVSRLPGSQEIAEDLTQEILWKAVNKIHTFRGGSLVRSWLTGIAVNHYIDFYRSRSSRSGREIHLDELSQKEATSEKFLIEGESLIHDQMMHDEKLAVLSSYIRQLPENHRLVVMHYRAGLKYDEIGERMKIPVGTVKSRINRTITLFRSIHMSATQSTLSPNAKILVVGVVPPDDVAALYRNRIVVRSHDKVQRAADIPQGTEAVILGPNMDAHRRQIGDCARAATKGKGTVTIIPNVRTEQVFEKLDILARGLNLEIDPYPTNGNGNGNGHSHPAPPPASERKAVIAAQPVVPPRPLPAPHVAQFSPGPNRSVVPTTIPARPSPSPALQVPSNSLEDRACEYIRIHADWPITNYGETAGKLLPQMHASGFNTISRDRVTMLVARVAREGNPRRQTQPKPVEQTQTDPPVRPVEPIAKPSQEPQPKSPDSEVQPQKMAATPDRRKKRGSLTEFILQNDTDPKTKPVDLAKRLFQKAFDAELTTSKDSFLVMISIVRKRVKSGDLTPAPIVTQPEPPTIPEIPKLDTVPAEEILDLLRQQATDHRAMIIRQEDERRTLLNEHETQLMALLEKHGRQAK